MLSPARILAWMEQHVKGMRRSRVKTLSAIVSAAVPMGGLGVLALGRAMRTATTAKHNIKRVNDFLGNAAVESEALAEGVFRAFAPRQGQVLVLVDWTDVPNAKLLVFALPRDGRALPFLCVCAPKDCEEGDLKAAEERGLSILERITRGCEALTLVTVADRGFGNRRWLTAVRARGWHYVQRLARLYFVDVEHYIGKLDELKLKRGARPRDWGQGTFGEDEAIEGRLVTVYDRKAKEPWFLVTDLPVTVSAAEVVGTYRRRMWIEALFRDCKNRDWGLRLEAVKLKDYRRYERLFWVFALAFIFLSAFGAAAEACGFDRTYQANTARRRVINLIRLGRRFLELDCVDLPQALGALQALKV